jgi:hypothetical protein
MAMADQQLRAQILRRAAADDDLGARARLVVSAAWDDLPADAPLTAATERVDAQVELLERLHAAASTAPNADDVERSCAAMRSAASGQVDAERVADALSADRIQFLETSLEFHARHGTQPCPVCAASALDDEWVGRARTALAAEKDAASALRVARSAAHRARQALSALVRAVQAPPADDAGLPEIVAARVAHQTFTTLPTDDDGALADHVAGGLPELAAAYDALGAAAATELAATREARTWLQGPPFPREQT